jgi:hypothetical protein
MCIGSSKEPAVQQMEESTNLQCVHQAGLTQTISFLPAVSPRILQITASQLRHHDIATSGKRMKSKGVLQYVRTKACVRWRCRRSSC